MRRILVSLIADNALAIIMSPMAAMWRVAS
jgi:hypothetical protein